MSTNIVFFQVSPSVFLEFATIYDHPTQEWSGRQLILNRDLVSIETQQLGLFTTEKMNVLVKRLNAQKSIITHYDQLYCLVRQSSAQK